MCSGGWWSAPPHPQRRLDTVANALDRRRRHTRRMGSLFLQCIFKSHQLYTSFYT